MNRKEKFSYLEERLCHLCNYINYCQCNNYTDINRISEGFINSLLNIVYGYECVDLNKIKANFPGVDLGDEMLGIGIQVTSACDSRKIKTTYEKIYDPRNAVDGKLIADMFDKQIIFFHISVERRPEIKEKSLEEIKEASHNRFKKADVIDMRDLISDIKELFDNDFERFMKAYTCVSRNIDALPEIKTDQCVLEDLLYYFNRPAFTTDFKYECSLEDFEKAITDTISNISTGGVNVKTGKHALAMSDLNSRELKKQFGEIVEGLNMLRKLYLTMLAKKYAWKVKIDEETVIYTGCEVIFCRAMNDARAVILHEIKRIADKENMEFDVRTSYYEDSFYHSPIIKGDTDNFILTMKRVFDVYTIKGNYERVIQNYY